MSLIPVMNNCALPNATPSPTTGMNPPICGLCGFTAMHKTGLWKTKIDEVWKRWKPTDTAWSSVPHLFAATPQKVIWEPLHCHCRCLDTVFKFFLSYVSGEAASEFATILHRAQEKYSATASLTINSVRFPTLFFFFSFFVPARNKKRKTKTKDQAHLPPRDRSERACMAEKAGGSDRERPPWCAASGDCRNCDS